MFNQSVMNGVGEPGGIVSTVANEDFSLGHRSPSRIVQQTEASSELRLREIMN